MPRPRPNSSRNLALLKKLTLSPIQKQDLTEIMNIETQCYPHPWSQKNFEDCLGGQYICMGCKLDTDMIGYFIIATYANEMHILNICVAPEYQKQGIGRHLLHQAESIGLAYDAYCSFLEVRISNQSALKLYRIMGYQKLGIRKNYYPSEQGREHAVVMKKIIKPEAHQEIK